MNFKKLGSAMFVAAITTASLSACTKHEDQSNPPAKETAPGSSQTAPGGQPSQNQGQEKQNQ